MMRGKISPPSLKHHSLFSPVSSGGYDKGPQMDRASMEVYDPDTGDWTFAPEMEKACSGLSMVTLDHFIYAFGGRYRHIDQYFDHVER